MLKKNIIISSLLCCCSLMLFGQASRSLPFLELNADSRSAGMGDATMGEAKGMYLYTNPTSFLQSESNTYASYTYALFPKINTSRLGYHAGSVGYKLDNRALMVGFRYMGGISIGKDANNQKSIKPVDWSLDLAYSQTLGENFSIYIGGNFIYSYLGKEAQGNSYSFSGGAYYRNKFTLGTTESNFTLGAGFYDIGAKLKYENDSYRLPSSTGIGGSLEMPFSKDHKINLALTTRYFFLPLNSSSLGCGLGLEYEMFRLVALRAGYHLEKLNNYGTVGLGLKTKFANLDIAYLLSNSVIDNNVLRFGVNLQF